MRNFSFGIFSCVLLATSGPGLAQRNAPSPPPAHAMPGTGLGDVPPDISLETWSKRVDAEIDRTLVYPHMLVADLTSRPSNGGAVRVKFNCTEGGGTANVSIRRSSGNRLYDAEALRVVGKLVQMHPLPTGMRNDQNYEAIIIFGGESSAEFTTRRAGARTEIMRRSAWFKPGVEVTATDVVAAK